MPTNSLHDVLCTITGAKHCVLGDVVQELWSGYGVIQRATFDHPDFTSAVVKHIDLSQERTNRRGWTGNLAHQRKIKSYQVEKAFYEKYSHRCSARCRVPGLHAVQVKEGQAGLIIVLEDLNVSGYDIRKNQVDQDEIESCLEWLAHFHATFMSCTAKELWDVGTYWHLKTRPEEWNAMADRPLKFHAATIDKKLNQARFQTLVHGDAKLANFCFGCQENGKPQVAAVDFQYVGRGCGMKDVAYLISCCMNAAESDETQSKLLDHYFMTLANSLSKLQPEIDFPLLEQEWRELYPYAWADFCRFLAGWSPGHWKLNQYSDRLTQSVLDQLQVE